MAEDDVETLAVLNYYMIEGYYRRVQMETMSAIKKYGSDPLLILYKGLSMLKEGRIQECMRELEGIRDRPDVSLASTAALIMAHKQSKSVDKEAVTELDVKLKEVRRSAGEKSLYFAGLTLWLLQKPDKAREYIERLVKNFNSAQGMILKGWLDLTSARDSYVKKSVKFFDEALSTNNRDPWALLGKAKYCMMRHKYRQASESLNKAIVLYANFTPAFVEKMKLHLALRDWDQTLDAANRLSNLDQHHPEALKTQIIHYLALGEKIEDVVIKIGDLIQVIDRFEPQNTNLYMTCGKIFSRMCGRAQPILNQTFTLLERAISVDSVNATYTAEIGWQYLLQGKAKEALKCFQSATNIDDTNLSGLLGAMRSQLYGEDFPSPKHREEAYNEISTSLKFLREVDHSVEGASEILFLSAIFGRKTNCSQEECYGYLKKSIKMHFEMLKSVPFGSEYIMALNPDFILEIARQLLEMGPAEAVRHGESVPDVLKDCSMILNEVLKSLPGLLDALYLYAKVKFLSGEPDESIATLQECLDRDSSYGDAHLLMARIYQERGNNTLASQFLESAMSHNFEIRDYPVYHLIKARTLMKSEEIGEAVQTLKLALALPGVRKVMSASHRRDKKSAIFATDRLSIFLELVRAHQKNNEQHEAIKVMQDAINAFQGTQEEVRVIIANADLSLQRGEVEEALTMLRDIKPEQSYFIQAKEKMASIYLYHRRDKALYTACYRELAKRKRSGRTMLLLGDAYMNIQEPEKAIEIYEKVMAENPGDGALASKIGQALVKAHDYRRAIAYYETALNNGGPQHLHFELAELLLQLKMHDKAESILTKIANEDNSHGETELEKAMFHAKSLLLLSSFYTEQERHAQAMEMLKSARDKQALVLKRMQREQRESVTAQKQIAANISCKIAIQEIEINKDKDSAIKFFKEALIYNEDDTQALLQLAKLHLGNGDLDMCQQYCMQILKQVNTTGHSEASMMMADMMFRKSAYDDAIHHYQKLLEVKPDYYEALARLIGLLRRSGKLQQACVFLGLDPDDEQNSDSEKMFNVKSGTSNDPGYHFCKGLYDWYGGRAKEALQSFNIARRDSDWGERAVENMIKICLNPDQDTLGGEAMQNLDDLGISEKLSASEAGVSTAERLLKELMKTPPSSPAARLRRQILEIYVLLSSRRKSETEKAVSMFIEILKTERDNVPCLLGMAIAFQILKQTPKARNQLKRIAKMPWTLEFGDDFEQAWLLLADLYIVSGKFDLATELLKKCINHNKSCCKAFEYLGYIQEKEQSYNEAANSYEKAWVLGNKSNPTIGYKLSFNYLKAKQLIEAINICHKVLETNPQYPKIKKDILDKACSALRT